MMANDNTAAAAVYTAGEDCSGFVQQAASYDYNLYNATDITHRMTWSDAGVYTQPKMSTWSWGVDNTARPIDIHAMVRGDKVNWVDHHVAMVYEISFTGTTSVLGRK